MWRPSMAYRPNPNDPFITPPPEANNEDNAARNPLYDDEGPVSGTRVALYAVAILALVAALFYGMSTAENVPAPAPHIVAIPAQASVNKSATMVLDNGALVIVIPRSDPSYDEMQKRFPPARKQ